MKNFIKKIIYKLGFELKKYSVDSSYQARFKKMISFHNIDTVIDVGANIGQYGQELRRNGFQGKIISIEPLHDARNILLKNSKKDSLWQVTPRYALGDIDGEIEINIAGNSASSSVLKMLDEHINAAPESKYIGAEKVQVFKLDTISKEYICQDEKLFLKIDTQGYEDLVLKGAKETIKKVKGIQLEISFLPLYEGQKLYKDLMNFMNDLGFELWDISSVLADKKSGRLLQCDTVFFRK